MAFDRARFYRDLAGEFANSSLRVRVANVSRSGDGWSVRFRGGFSVYQCTDGQQSVGDGFVGTK